MLSYSLSFFKIDFTAFFILSFFSVISKRSAGSRTAAFKKVYFINIVPLEAGQGNPFL